MKKLIAILLCMVMVLSMVACGGEKNPTTDEKVITIGVFEPTSGQNGAGGKKEILGSSTLILCIPPLPLTGKNTRSS